MIYHKCNLSVLASGRHACFYARGRGENADLLYKSQVYINQWEAKFAALGWLLMASPTQIISFEKDLHLPNVSRQHWASKEKEVETTFGIVYRWVCCRFQHLVQTI